MNPFVIAAIIVYGALAVVAALVTASIGGSVPGAALAFAGAGLTYVFHVLQLARPQSGALNWLWLVVIALLLLSVLVSLGADRYVL